jgi:2-iminobutanoate/2-iminopropanoate deaminase
MRKTIHTDWAPKAIGPYSQGVKITGNLLLTSGMIPMLPDTGELVDGDIAEQTAQALDNLRAIVEEAGGTMDDIVKTNVYLADINDFVAMNTIYAQYFSDNPPARVCVEVSNLPKGALIEIDAIAKITDSFH